MGNRPNVCKHNCPKIHKGQHQQGRRGIWKGFTHLVSKKIDTIFTNKAWETLTAGKRQSALACPFLNVVDTAGGARFGQVGAPWSGGHMGMGWARRIPQLLPHQRSPAETQSPLDPGTSPWARWVLASCAQNQEFQVSSKSDKGRSSAPAEQLEMTSPTALSWGCNPAPLQQNLSFFLSECLRMKKSQVFNLHGPDYSCSKHKIKWQRGSKSWQIAIFIIISFLAVSGAFYHSQASQKSNSYLKD